MNKKKVIALLTVTAMSMTIFAGCGSKTSNSDATSKADTTTKKTETSGEQTIRFSWWGGDSRNEATLEVIKQFEKENPGITVEAQYGGSDGYADKLATQLTSGTEPDIMQIDPETMPQYVNAGDYFTDYLATDFDFSNFDKDFLESSYITGYYDGKQYGIPTGIAGVCLLVNQTLADEMGIDFSKDFTWDDLITWGKEVHEKNPDVYLIHTNQTMLNNAVFNYYTKQLTGDSLFNQDTGKLVATEEDLEKSFSYINSLFENNVVSPISTMTQYDGDNMQSDPNWINGNYVACFTYVSTAEVLEAANTEAEYSMGQLPSQEGQKVDGWVRGCPQILALSKNSANLDACIKFLNYFYNSEKAVSTLAATRSVPPTDFARKIVEADGNLSPLLSDAVNFYNGKTGLQNDTISSTPESKQIIVDGIVDMAYGNVSPKDLATSVYDQYKELEK